MAKLRPRSDRGGRFELDYMDVDGARYRINTGTSDPKVADLWLKKAEERLSQARLGIIEIVGPITAEIVSGKKAESKSEQLTLEDLEKEYTERCHCDLGMKANSIELAHTAFKSLINVVGNKRISKFSQDDVIKWKRRLDSEGKKKTTVSIYYRTLRAAFNRAIKWKLIENNPLLNVEIPSVRKGDRERKHLSHDEVKKLLKVVGEDNPQFALYLQFLFYTGCRRNEILFLTWENIDMEERILRVKADKTDTTLLLPINTALYNIIGQLRPGTGYVFKTGSSSRNRKKLGLPWHESTVTHWFKMYVGEADLPKHYTLHCMRHTFTNMLRKKGVPIDIIQKLLGHATVRTTWDHYDASDALFYRDQSNLLSFEED